MNYLIANVEVDGSWYGPAYRNGDAVPPEVAEKITNPAVWGSEEEYAAALADVSRREQRHCDNCGALIPAMKLVVDDAVLCLECAEPFTGPYGSLLRQGEQATIDTETRGMDLDHRGLDEE